MVALGRYIDNDNLMIMREIMKRSEASKLKKEGVKAGVPDLFLPIAKHGYHGLFIELKYGSNKATAKQREWIIALNKQGYHAVVCNGFEEAKTIIEEYIK